MAAGGGGSWKVAFADFMTAMMALFLVLWILNQSETVKGNVEEFFKNPWKAALSDSTGIIPVKDATVTTSQKSNFDAPSAIQLDAARRINEDLLKTFVQNKEFREHRSMVVEMTSDGLLINFLDNPSQPVFQIETNSVKFTEYGRWVFDTVAWEIARYPSTAIELEGHTESGFKTLPGDYGSWEVSLDEAKLARQQLLKDGVTESQIIKISGYAGTRSLKDRQPNDRSNRRVTIMIRAGREE
ncbi:MAG: hypothetical protein FJ398_23795 [Verrucomicrobia bacterium]|nr:hypothetical protein [Verrucomicrobiota bacterium]